MRRLQQCQRDECQDCALVLVWPALPLPRQAIGLPISHVVCMLVPCMYCLTNCGSVNARQTAAAEALMVTCFSAMNVAVILTSSMSGLMALQMYDPII